MAGVIDERLIGALHLTSGELGDEVEPAAAHAIFQTSTVAALLDGAYEGDVTFGELARHGDLGLGTLNGCDGEMIAVEGRFFRADANGDVRAVGADEQTPFAVLARFDPAHRFEVGGGGEALDFDGLCAAIDERVGHPEIVHAVRIDGDFERLHLRSVPKQEPPYRPLAEVLADQSIFDFGGEAGTIVGFRFPDFGEGVEIAGYHLHFISADRTRGGHVLDLRTGSAPVHVAVDDLADLYVETPPGIAVGGSVDQRAVQGLERD